MTVTAGDTPNPMLLLHGLLSTPQEFSLVGHRLRALGVRHAAPVLPGYTAASDDIAFDWRQWLASAEASLPALQPGEAPTVIGGLCMGGILAAALALTHPERVSGLVLMSPSFSFDGWGLSPWRHLRHVAYWTGLDRYFHMNEREPFGVKNARIRTWIATELRERAQSAAGPARVPLRALRQAELMLAWVRANLHQLRCPILLIHARDDEISSLDGVVKLFNALPQRDKQLVVLEDSYHMITIDNEHPRVAAMLETFQRRISERGEGAIAPAGAAFAH